MNKLCYMTASEARKTQEWISKNSFSLNEGHFELSFTFSPYGDDIEVAFMIDKKCFSLEINDLTSTEEGLRSVDHVAIEKQQVSLFLTDEVLEKYLQSAREVTEAHVNLDCEPPGAGIIFEIYSDRCNVLTNRRHLLDAQ